MKLSKCSLSVREIVILALVVGAAIIAMLDRSFRQSFFGLAEAGLVGYFAQMFPEQNKQETPEGGK